MIGKTLMVAIIVVAILCGCTPDETNVTVNASALKAATEGNTATARVKIVVKTSISRASVIPEKIRHAALPHLGKEAEIKIEAVEKANSRNNNGKGDQSGTKDDQSETKFIATFNIPVGTVKALQKDPHGILQLLYTPEDKTFRLVYGPKMSLLNSALKKINGGFSLEYTGGYISRFLFGGDGTTINILNDDTITLGVAAVTVNGQGVIAGSVDTHKGSLLIDYGNRIYSGKAPCFTYGGFQAMSSCSPITSGK